MSANLVDKIMDRMRLTESYQAIFSSKDGERVLRHLVKIGNVDSTSFTKGDPHLTSFEEGKRYIVLNILAQLKRDSTEDLRLIQQNETQE